MITVVRSGRLVVHEARSQRYRLYWVSSGDAPYSTDHSDLW